MHNYPSTYFTDCLNSLPAVSVAPGEEPMELDSSHVTPAKSNALSANDIARVATGDDLLGHPEGQALLKCQAIGPGTIEKTLMQHPMVQAAVVLQCKRNGYDDHLVAYVITTNSSATQVSGREVKKFLHPRLPSNMIPPIIFPVSSFIVTGSGEVDCSTMASPKFVDNLVQKECSSFPSAAHPETPLDVLVRRIFAAALKIPEDIIGLHTNFFDIGGNSLTAVRIVSTICDQFQVPLLISTFANNATIAFISRYIAFVQPVDQLAAPAYAALKSPSNAAAFPASHAQVGLWVEEQMNPGLATYNTGFQRRLAGALDVNALKRAFLVLLGRHDVLRTTFSMEDEVLTQHVQPMDSHGQRVTLFVASPDEHSARKLLQDEASRLFDLSRDFPVRFLIIQVTPSLHFVSVLLHHIVADGWSIEVIEREMAILYNTLRLDAENDNPLGAVGARFGDICSWKKPALDLDKLSSQLQYWIKELQGARPLELFTDYPRPRQLSGAAKEIPFIVGPNTLGSLRRLSATHRTSLYVTLLAIFRSVIFRMNGEEDGLVGMVNANRPASEAAGVVGHFVNPMALRLRVTATSRLEEVISVTRKVVIDALQHADVPFEHVVAALAPERNIARKPLCQLELVLQDFSLSADGSSAPSLDGLDSEDIRMPSTNLDLAIHLFPEGDMLQGYIMYQSDLFSEETVAGFLKVFNTVTQHAISNPKVEIATMDLFTVEDSERLARWNNTALWVPLPNSLVDGFLASVTAHPNDIALVDRSTSLTYSELNSRTDSLASWLVERDFASESVVGIFMGRSALLVVAYLACLKAGLCYLPLDKALPEARLRYMLKASGCQLVLSNGAFPLAEDVDSVDLTENDSLFSTRAVPFPPLDRSSACCVLFTSGSTGVPKGIIVEHGGMLNLCAPGYTHWPGRLRSPLLSGISFDPSGFQIFSPLLTAAPLYCWEDEGMFDAHSLIQFLLDFSIERCDVTPSILSTLLDIGGNDWLERSALVHMLIGGEKVVSSKLLEVHRRKPSLKITSVYGPTEASVTTINYNITPEFYARPLRQVPIGFPLPNTVVYVVDSENKPVPAGVVGQILLGGPQLCRGYIGQPGLTDVRFIHIADGGPLGDQRLYLTGDLGFWTSDGLLQFVGRMDSQVKIRGQRIETEEVEHAVESSPLVRSCTVVAVQNDSQDLLVGYVQLELNSENEADLLAMWKEQYNEESVCEDLANVGSEFDSAQWRSMMDDVPIPQEEMDEWLGDTITQIAPRVDDRVLEIGVGTGQIALRLQGCVASFVGTDISQPSLAFTQDRIVARGLSDTYSLHHGAAHELYDLFSTTKPTLVVINSVAQYFPSAKYLSNLIEHLATCIEEGRIFIGDVRSYDLIPYHDTERVVKTAPSGASLDDAKAALERFSRSQTELLLSPSFFHTLARQIPTITHVQIMPKTMSSRNELSRYRYTVIMHVRNKPTILTPSAWLDGSRMDLLPAELFQRLTAVAEDVVGITGLPILDVARIQAMHSAITNPEACADDGRNVASLRSQLEELPDTLSSASSPGTLARIAQDFGWTALFDYSSQGPGTDNFFQAIFTRTSNLRGVLAVGGFCLPKLSATPSHNTIVSTLDVAQAKQLVLKHVRNILPKFMIPHLVHIESAQWPMSTAGKLDRKRLETVEFFQAHDTRVSGVKGVECPSTETEQQVLEIFAQTLKQPAEQINIRDSLFTIGGHSLMATLVVARILREIGVSVPMSFFFLNATVYAIAKFIDDSHNSPDNTPGELRYAFDPSRLGRETIKANTDRPGPTLFLFPETTGFATSYSSAIPHISHKVVCFGDDRWGQPAIPSESLHAIGADGAQKILEHQPEGPYYVAGWSPGGYVALTTALQLESLGKKVDLVVLFDTGFPDDNIGDLEFWTPDLDHLLDVVDSKQLWLTQFNRMNGMVQQFTLEPGMYDGKVVLIRATQPTGSAMIDSYFDDPHRGWKRSLPQIEVLRVDATHGNMFNAVNGKVVGEMISKILKELEHR